MHIRTITPLLLASLMAPNSVILAQEPAATQLDKPTSEAQQAFDKLKTLSGTWHGKIMNIAIEFTIRPVSSGKALLHEGHTEGGGPPNHEITMFYIEDDRLLATHYCDAGNRGRWIGKLSQDKKSVEFTFLDINGSKKGGYLRGAVFTLNDQHKHSLSFDFVMPDGKPILLQGDFAKVKQ